MKKVLFAISIAALALVSCTKFETEPEVTFETAAAPTVNVEVTGDNSIALEVLPGSNTGYYAYALLEGEVEASSVDAATLLAGKVSGLKKEVASAAKKDTLKAAVAKLTSNTQYTVVAVASSKGTQSLSEVVAKTVTTTDETVPDVDDYDYDVDGKDLTFYVYFDDPIKLTDKAQFVVQTYGDLYYDKTKDYLLLPLSQTVVPKENISINSDGSVAVVVPDDTYAPGAYVALFIGEGSVKNALDAVNPAFNGNAIYNKRTSKGKTVGLIAKYENVPFELECPIAEDSVFKFSDPALCSVAFKPKFVGYSNAAGGYGNGDVQVVYEHALSGRTINYTLTAWDWDSEDNFVVETDEDPELGYYVSYDIEEDCVRDIYGNPNAATKIEGLLFCSYGYTMADVVGDYDVNTINALAGAPATTTLNIKEGKGGSLIVTFSGAPGFSAAFDPDLGTIELTKQSVTVDNVKYSLSFNGASSATIAVPAPGKLSNNSNYFLVDNGSAYILAYATIDATRK